MYRDHHDSCSEWSGERGVTSDHESISTSLSFYLKIQGIRSVFPLFVIPSILVFLNLFVFFFFFSFCFVIFTDSECIPDGTLSMI